MEDALLIASGPADAVETCGLMFTQVIHMARERLWIASPYFVPDVQILGALKLAVLRGVDVRILIPEKSDHRTVHLASFSYYDRTLPLGIKLYRYTAGFLHQKVFLVDRNCAAVGTANLDNRSFRLNFELTLLNYDAALHSNGGGHARRRLPPQPQGGSGRIHGTPLPLQTGGAGGPPAGPDSLTGRHGEDCPKRSATWRPSTLSHGS